MTTRRIGLLLVSILLGGCSFFSRSQSHVYSLDRIPPSAVADVRGVPIAIDGIELPPGVDRREIVVRQADHRLDIRSADLWPASLQPLILHTLASDLADRLPEGMVILPGEAERTGVTRSIDVVVEELAAGPQSSIVLDARWTLRESGRPEVSHHERIETPVTGLDSASVATGMGQTIAALADRIVAQLR